MKITKQKLKQIIKEEINSITLEAGDIGELPSRTMASKLAAGDIARQPEGSRSELAQLFRSLLGKLGETNPEEVEALADTVAPMLGMLAIGTPLVMAIEKRLSKGDDS